MRISDWSSDVCSSDLWLERLRGAEAAATEKLMPMFLTDKAPISPYRVAWEINEFLTDNTIYIGDGGDVVTITAQAVQPRRPRHWMDPGPPGTLGVGTGFAMAAKLAHPEKETGRAPVCTPVTNAQPV